MQCTNYGSSRTGGGMHGVHVGDWRYLRAEEVKWQRPGVARPRKSAVHGCPLGLVHFRQAPMSPFIPPLNPVASPLLFPVSYSSIRQRLKRLSSDGTYAICGWPSWR
jgi:hypothetical protein